ncbi:MAG: GAF domain-containing protein [Bdellovibrionales bacterium]|nr:GAF domain-containing protein [Ramlibacter sp.]
MATAGVLDKQRDPTNTFSAIARHDAQPGAADTASASDEPFRALFESLDQGVATLEVLFDEHGHAIDYRFLAVNRAHQAISGLGSEVVGKRFSEVMPGIDPSVIQRIGKVALSGESLRFEDFISPLDRWFEAFLARVGHQGSRTVVAVYRDITERKQRERLQVFLLTLSDALRPLNDPQEIQVLAANLLGEHLQVNQANYGEVWGEQVHISHSYANGLPPMVGTFDPESFGKRLIDGHRAGKLQVCANTTTDPLFDEQERQALAAVNVGAYVAVPLVKQGVCVGVLSVLNIRPRDWAPTEVEAVQEVAERTWAAVERTRAERALFRSEEKFRSLFESIDEGVCTLEVLFDENKSAVDYRILEINPAHEAMSGQGREVIGKRGLELIPSLEPRVMERLGQVVLTGHPIRFEDYVSGLGIWFDVYLARDGGQDSRRVISVFSNITERKRREHLQAFLLTLSDALQPHVDPQAIQALAADLLSEHLQGSQLHYGEARGQHVHVSHSFANGLAPLTGPVHAKDFGERLIDRHRAGRLHVCVNTTSDPLVEDEERKVLAAANIGAYIAAPLVKEGVCVAVLAVHSTKPRDWTPTEVEAVQEVAERIWAAVERSRAERALTRSEEKYRSLFESIDEGVATIEVLFDDQDQAIDYRVVEVNASHEAMSGIGREIVGKRIRELIPDIPTDLVERVGQVALTGQPIRFEEFVSGLNRWFDIYLARDGGSESRRVISVSSNITERKRREHHAAFLEKLSQALVLLGSPEEIVRVTGEALGPYMDVSYFHVVGVELDPGDEPAETRLTVLAAWERKGFYVAGGAYRAGDYLSEEFLRAARAGEPIVVRDTDTDPRTDGQAYRAVGIRAFSAVPILNGDTWPGLISVGTPGVRDWRPDEVTLIAEVAHRVFVLFERTRAEDALRHSAARTRELQRRLMEMEEHERRALHRELHDRIGQDLATAKLNIELARALPPGEVGNRLGMALELLQSAITTSRNIMAELRPPGLDDHGLGVAIRILAESLEDRLPIAVSVSDVDFELRLPHLVEAALFRIAQEAVLNLTKHANAQEVEISFVRKAQEVRLVIADDGCGFDANRLAESGSYGLQIMRERAEAVNAKLTIDSAPGRGTRIIAVLEHAA